MRHYEVRRHIAAEPAVVWQTLTDPAALIAAGTGIERIDGAIAPGERFTLWSTAAPGRGFRTRVTELTAPSSMEWTGGMPAGLFRGVRRFALSPARGGTDFHMREEFTGLMLPLIWRTMPDLQPSFEAFADGLARASEAAVR
ncbi:MAG: SRPBCC domain-containing protein [Kineosporiaceae bacterium]|nr:SRPBCC domain-containing protein [Kineosporiaceae bacterium]